MSSHPNIFTVRKRVVYPEKLKYVCSAFPPRRGYLTVSMGSDEYEMFAIGPGKTFELVFPRSDEDGWIPTCIQNYIGPDLVMIDDNVYTNYIKLI